MENMHNLGIREFMDQMFYDAVHKYNDLVSSAFRSLGYTRNWIFENRNRIRVDRITGSPFHEQNIYYLDGKPIFAIDQTTEIRTENNIYRFLADWQVRYF